MATLTPFRYPGAKNKLISILDASLIDLGIKQNSNFIDAFVGGGSVLLNVAERYPNLELFGNDKDYWMASFWKIVSDGQSLKLQELLDLMAQPVTLEHFYKLRQTPPISDVEAAYRAIFFNRTTFSGILYSGPIGGKEQKSKYKVDCRYNYSKLKEKILVCHELLKGRTTIENVDFEKYSPLVNENWLVYLDPPYVVAGESLYTEHMSETAHENLGKILLNRKNWLLSYDDSDIIRRIYQNCNIYNISGNYSINGAKIKWSQKNVLLITSK